MTYTADQIAAALGSRFAPTPEQRAIIEYPLTPLLVVAGAGSGKTATMTQRVVYLVANEIVRPDEILGLTFTKKATAELSSRVRAQLAALTQSQAGGGERSGASQPEPADTDADMGEAEPDVATYDSFAGRIVRDHGLRIGVDPDMTLLTDARAWQIVGGIVDSLEGELLATSRTSMIKDVIYLDSSLNDHLLSVEEAREQITDLRDFFTTARGIRGGAKHFKEPANRHEKLLALLDVVADYRSYKQRHHLATFSDRTAMACQIVRNSPEAVAEIRSHYRAIVLDEFQDTSVAQVSLLSGIFADMGVTAVGDPNQAIYGWRGASASALDGFHTHFNPGHTREGVPAPVMQLSIAWRNDLKILDAANIISRPLRSRAVVDGDPAPSSIEVSQLQPRGADIEPGTVAVAYTADPIDEAEVIADYLEPLWNEQASMAVLCRTRGQFLPILEALQRRGLPAHAHSSGGMVDLPEVLDITSLLTHAINPERGDVLMRLLTSRGLGAADIDSLYRYGRGLCADPHDPAALGEALSAIMDGERPASLTPAGLRVCQRVGEALAQVRDSLSLPLLDVLDIAQRSLDIDIDVQARGTQSLGARGCESFFAAAAGFVRDTVVADVPSFLAWVDAVRNHERGLELPTIEQEPGTIQIMTVHASKGLEWDTVCVSGLSEKGFPSYSSAVTEDLTVSANSWLTRADEFPHPLRADAETLPPCTWLLDEPDSDTIKEISAACEQYKQALGRYTVREERRLAYVAATRARHTLLLTGSYFRKDSVTTLCPPSRFLSEVIKGAEVDYAGPGMTAAADATDNAAVSRVTEGMWPLTVEHMAGAERTHWERQLRAATLVRDAQQALAQDEGPCAMPQDMAARQASLAASMTASSEATTLGDAAAGNAVPGGASLSGTELGSMALSTAEGQQWARDCALLLAEAAHSSHSEPSVVMPAHIPATAVHALRTDPQAYPLAIRRPVPGEPHPQTRLGTVFHELIAQRLSSQTGLLSLVEGGAPDTLTERQRDTVERWCEVAIGLDLLEGCLLEGTELDRDLRVGDVTIRCRIDAVFRTPAGGWLIVDWKTGRTRQPVDQLSLYVHAWARSVGCSVNDVRAAYAYVATGQVDELKPADLLSVEQVAESIPQN